MKIFRRFAQIVSFKLDCYAVFKPFQAPNCLFRGQISKKFLSEHPPPRSKLRRSLLRQKGEFLEIWPLNWAIWCLKWLIIDWNIKYFNEELKRQFCKNIHIYLSKKPFMWIVFKTTVSQSANNSTLNNFKYKNVQKARKTLNFPFLAISNKNLPNISYNINKVEKIFIFIICILY